MLLVFLLLSNCKGHSWNLCFTFAYNCYSKPFHLFLSNINWSLGYQRTCFCSVIIITEDIRWTNLRNIEETQWDGRRRALSQSWIPYVVYIFYSPESMWLCWKPICRYNIDSTEHILGSRWAIDDSRAFCGKLQRAKIPSSTKSQRPTGKLSSHHSSFCWLSNKHRWGDLRRLLFTSSF